MGMSGGGGGGHRAPLGEINVTPLVDVMLVLLIIFMVAAPMMATGVPVDLPAARAERMEVEQDKILLSVTAEPKVYIGEDEVPIERLGEVLRTNAKLQADREIFVQGDSDVPYGYMVRVFGLVREAGITKVGLVTDPAGGALEPVAGE
jgi:biopolymer transport protein TolR